MNRIADRLLLTLAVLLFGALIVAARKPKDAGQSDGPVVHLKDAPKSAREMKNPLAADEQTIAAGRKLFLRHCASCHGEKGEGRGHAADLHAEEIREAPAGVLFWAISNGRLKKGMPSWSGLPPAQRWQLVTYLKSRQ
ncbi:MAG: c-type cytochrome [Deltaproteobacteria bacterium]